MTATLGGPWTRSAAQPIITPEAVVLDLRPAGVASRILAITIDGLAIVATMALLLLVAAMTLPDLDGVGAAVGAVLTSLVVVLGWFCGFEALWHGCTPGKAALGLRVVGVDGTPVRFQQAFTRAVLGLVDFFAVPIGFVAVVTVLLSPRDQRLGDMLAGTLVVRERSAGGYAGPAWFPPPPGFEAYAASLDVGALDEAGYGIVRSYLLRWPQLTPAARDHLAVRLANPIAVRMHHTPPRHVHPYAFLACVAAAWQRAHGAVAVPSTAWGAAPAPVAPPSHPPPPPRG